MELGDISTRYFVPTRFMDVIMAEMHRRAFSEEKQDEDDEIISLKALENSREVRLARLLAMQDCHGVSKDSMRRILGILQESYNDLKETRQRIITEMKSRIPLLGDPLLSRGRFFHAEKLLRQMLWLNNLGPGIYHVLFQGDGHRTGRYKNTVSLTLKLLHVRKNRLHS